MTENSHRVPSTVTTKDERVEAVIEAACRVSTGTHIADREHLVVRRRDMEQLWHALDNLK